MLHFEFIFFSRLFKKLFFVIKRKDEKATVKICKKSKHGDGQFIPNDLIEREQLD